MIDLLVDLHLLYHEYSDWRGSVPGDRLLFGRWRTYELNCPGKSGGTMTKRKHDKRFLRTRAWIVQAFNELIFKRTYAGLPTDYIIRRGAPCMARLREERYSGRNENMPRHTLSRQKSRRIGASSSALFQQAPPVF